MIKTIALCLTALALVGCTPEDTQDDDKFVSSVRANDLAEGYSRDSLVGIHSNLCALREGDRIRILDNYKGLTNLEEIVDISTLTC